MSRPAHVSVAVAPKTLTCAKCDGKGRISGFAHYADGVCFQCGGAGTFAQDAKMTDSKWYRQQVELAKYTAAIVMDASDRGLTARAESYVGMLLPRLFALGTAGAREVLNYVGAGRWYDSEECAWRQLAPAKARDLRAQIIAAGNAKLAA